MAESWIKFLGTAGARFVVSKQLRASGGLWVCLEGVHVLVDPGPGSLVRCLASKPKLDPSQLTAILLSHRHLDHSNDVNIMIEAMTEGGFKPRGRVFVPGDAVDDDPVLLRYVHAYVNEVVRLQAGGRYPLGPGVHFETPVAHRHGPETYGFRFETRKHTISYVTCTVFFPELLSAYGGCDLLLIHTVRLKKEAAQDKEEHEAKIKHLALEDARTLIEAIRPKTAILTHFGMTMVRAQPWELAKNLSRETGIDVIAARDGMKFDLD